MDVGAHLEGVLDQPAIDIHDAFPLLFPTGPTRDRRVTSQEEFSLMFLLPESLGEANIRAELEPLVELFQIKGGSECRFSAQHPGA
jgi:hypothetical protein